MNSSGGSWAKPGIVLSATLALLVVALLVAQSIVWNHSMRKLSKNMQSSLDRSSLIFETRLRSRVNDLFMLKTLAEQDLAHGESPEATWNKFHATAAALMFTRACYDQIRLLNLQGHETFRLNWNPDGNSPVTCVHEVPPAELQDKSDRSYFSSSLEATSDTAVLSPLDLNLEQGKVETPIKSTLRVSGQIRGADGRIQAIIVLNALGDLLLRDLKEDAENSFDRTWALNPDGYWLSNPDPTKDWAFMYPERKNETLQKTDPLLWQKFNEKKEGSFAYHGMLYSFRKIDPVSPQKEYNPLRMKIQGASEVDWLLVNIAPESAVWNETAAARLGIWIVFGVAVLTLGPTSWFGTLAIRRWRDSIREVARARRQLDEVMNASLHGMVAMAAVRDPQGKIIDFHTSMANTAAERLTGEKITTCLGSTYFAGGPARVNFEHYSEVVETGNPVTFEHYQGKTALWLAIRAAKWGDGVVISFADITDRKKAEENLQFTSAALEAANASLKFALTSEQELSRRANAAERAKGEFLAMMSHEIRTPMNGVLGFAEMLKKTPLESEQKEYVQTIVTSGEALLRIIDDVLDFSRIEAGRIEIVNNIFSPREVLESVCSLLHPRASQKGISLTTELSNTLPERAIGDAGRLRQILINLVGNALKFTSSGSIWLRAKAEPFSPSRMRLDFAVADTGDGIAKDKLESIFKPFMQADSSIARRYGGAGLGLAISQRLVKLMGGKLSVESSPETGSLFTFSLSLEIPDAAALSPAIPDDQLLDTGFALQHPLRILVAEDDEVNLRLLSMILRKLGYEPITAKNGKEAIELANTERPDCILMDIHMPDVDGIEAAQKIRSHESDVDRAFIAALTADVMPEERERAFAAGIDDYLTKPLKRDALVRVLILASQDTAPTGKA